MTDEVAEPAAAVRWSRELLAGADARAPLMDPTAAYLGSLSPKGRQTMVERLRAVATLIGVPYAEVAWHEFRFQHVDFLRQRLLEQGRSPATVNLTLAAFRGIARYARNLGLMTAEEHDRIRDVKGARGSRLPAGRAVLAGELGALVGACAADPTPAGTRDAAIFAVLYIGGIRRSELAGLDLADWTPTPPTLRIRHGKGDKERLVPLVGAAAAALDDWLAVRGDRTGRALPRDHPAPPARRHGDDQPRRLQYPREAAARGGRGAAVAARLPAHLRRGSARRGDRSLHRAAARRARERGDDGALRPTRRGDQASRGRGAPLPLPSRWGLIVSSAAL